MILLVEDNPKDEALAMRALKKNNIGNNVIVARDGVEAIDYFFAPNPDGSFKKLPRLVLLDLNLPKLNGHEVLKRLREDVRTRLLPVVILTTSVEARDRFEGYRLGANSYVRKPVDFTEFIDVVSRLGQYWLRLNEDPPVSH